MKEKSVRGQDVKVTDAASYDAVAATFDQLSERFSAPIAARLIDLARIAPSARVLDLGTGAGLLALRAAEQARAGRVVGIDHSPGMLHEAKSKAEHQGLSERTDFLQMDAEALTFGAASFDVAVSLFVFLHLPDPLAAARELLRVLAPGGRVVIGLGSGAPLLSLAGASQAGRRLFEALAYARGRVLTAPAFMNALLAEMGLAAQDGGHMPHQHGIDAANVLAAAGFRDVRSSWTGATFYLSPSEFWDVCATYGSAERVRLSEMSPETRDDVKKEFLRRAGQVADRNGKLIYRCGARIHVATRPDGPTGAAV